jgi:hypothetical protein
MAALFDDDRIGSGGSNSHAHVESRRYQEVLAVDQKDYVCRMNRRFAAVLSTSWGGDFTGSAMLLRVSDYFDGSLFSFSSLFISFLFWLCASLMFRLVLVIMLLQRLGL